tara:strand:- start:66 stop:947 length:882 start_codon:yes stop_codon:yes gene_type:complete
MTTRDDDALMDVVVVDTHDTLLFFTNRGRVYPLRVFQIAPDTSRTSRGTLLVNLIPLAAGEQIESILPTKNPKEGDLLVLATQLGEVKALKEGALSNIQQRGLIVMDLEPGDELVSVKQLGDAEDVVMVSETGQSIRFPIRNLAPRSRTAGGVRGMRLREGDKVVAMITVSSENSLLVVSERGYGKATPLSMYPTQSRGGLGVRTFKVTDKTGRVAAARVVSESEGYEVFIISAMAQVVRINLEDVRITGRNTQGVIVWRDRDPDDYVASIACFQENDYTEDMPAPTPKESKE